MKIITFPSFLILATAFLPACASHQPRPVASYSSALHEPTRESRGLVAMCDEDIGDQAPGTTATQRTASSESISKKGKPPRQKSETTELIETDISTVIETTTAPTADQDIP
jgi:hypothetical protein